MGTKILGGNRYCLAPGSLAQGTQIHRSFHWACMYKGVHVRVLIKAAVMIGKKAGNKMFVSRGSVKAILFSH